MDSLIRARCRRPSARRLVHDQRGGALVETLVAFPVLFLTIMGLHLFCYQCIAHLALQRAASAAARAAVVFLPNDPSKYALPGPSDPEEFGLEAARRVLLAAPYFVPSSLQVELSGARAGHDLLTATVRTQFDCSSFLAGRIVCGLDARAPMRAAVSFPYQGGR